MVVRRRRKYRKKLGSRSYHGDTKNRRGKGIRGGVGRAGAWDHKFSLYYRTLFKKGFKPPRRKEERAINVGDVEELLPRLRASGHVKEENGKLVVDLEAAGYTRLLGRGEISSPVVLRVPYASPRAVEKVEAAGGQVIARGSEGV